MVKSKYKEKGNNLINVVYIGGFLVPRGRMPYSDDFHLPKSTRVILVYPSGVSSMHDRVMQIFYELKGGTVHYGEEHSKFHKHAPTGVTFNRPKLPEWNEDNPVHVIGHSYGGITARALYYYLSQGNMFHGHVTNSSWIVSVTAVNSPLNGCLRVYSYGANLISPSIVRWASLGCCIGWLAHLLEFLDNDWLKTIYDFQLGYWGLSYKLPQSFHRLFLAMLGCCIHTTTDNSAYDMTVHSQVEWAPYLQDQPSTYYLSIVGTSFGHAPWSALIPYLFTMFHFNNSPSMVCGLNTSQWSASGFDGVLTVQTQIFPFLHYLLSNGIPTDDSSYLSKIWDVPHVLIEGDEIPWHQLRRGTWFVKMFPIHHLDDPSPERTHAWRFILTSIQDFHAHHLSERKNFKEVSRTLRTSRTNGVINKSLFSTNTNRNTNSNRTEKRATSIHGRNRSMSKHRSRSRSRSASDRRAGSRKWSEDSNRRRPPDQQLPFAFLAHRTHTDAPRVNSAHAVINVVANACVLWFFRDSRVALVTALVAAITAAHSNVASALLRVIVVAFLALTGTSRDFLPAAIAMRAAASGMAIALGRAPDLRGTLLLTLLMWLELGRGYRPLPALLALLSLDFAAAAGAGFDHVSLQVAKARAARVTSHRLLSLGWTALGVVSLLALVLSAGAILIFLCTALDRDAQLSLRLVHLAVALNIASLLLTEVQRVSDAIQVCWITEYYADHVWDEPVAS